ncbi:proton-conducting transporter membrane subunit [Acidiferrobacter sp.]|uniref:NADH-quinone oxidoreductase subunit 5 family protein n=1 Tax=Acidiferrobacter sp. TaxID=1872107 RepID=UPI002608830D|nr:proton-conducting transporter membrane subunit [Acidiferrobacter sp.]
MESLGVWVPALPVASALFILVFLRGTHRAAARVSLSALTLSLLLAAGLLVRYLMGGGMAVIDTGGVFGSLWLDPLSLVLWAFVSGISLIVHIYSVRYMAEEPGYARFFALLDLMTGVILVMVSAANLVTLLVAWFLVGVVLYFLLGHDHRRPAAGRYAFWTQITYRFGDLPLWLAALILVHSYHSVSLPVIFARIHKAPGTELWGMPVPELTGFLLALAAFARSAQFPLHIWLPYTMDGPTPVSALMHAGIVNAGGFLFNRFAPLFEHAGWALHWTFGVGLMTALIGSGLMLMQNDIKRSLGYSTMGQMGFMVMECGLGAFPLAVFHLIAHGFFKASLFLGAGDVIGDARAHDGVPADPIYTSVVERRPAKPSRLPWLVAASLTVLVPVVVLSLSHFFVAEHLFYEQGVVVLLFFGWVTGAQALFAAHKMSQQDPWRLMLGILSSFVVVVIGYTLISHYFGQLLYPDEHESLRLYQAASIHRLSFDALVMLLAAVFVGGWALTFFAESFDFEGRLGARGRGVYLGVYALLSRELYVADVYERSSQLIVQWSRRLNVWLRWC